MLVQEQEILDPKKLASARFLSKLTGTFNPPANANIPLDKDSIKRILVQEHQCIGDVLMIEPALASLKRGFPKAQLDLLCVPSLKILAQRSGIADTILSYPDEKPDKTYYDLVIDFHGDIRRLRMLKHYHARYRAGFSFSGGARWLSHVIDYPYMKHQVERPLELLDALDIQVVRKIPELKGFEGIQCKEDRILLHSGANHPDRKWPVEHWKVLGEMLINEGYDVIWINPPGESPNFKVQQFSGNLVELAELISSASLLIGCDSMSGHLAAALKTPTVTIFGSQNPSLTRPYHSEGHIVLPKEDCTHPHKDWRLCAECMNSIPPAEIAMLAKKIV
jgi:ADP-heptose:LPS heptosyltransferase